MKSVFWEVDSQHVQMLYMNKVNYEELLACQKVGHICMHYCTLLFSSLTCHSCSPASSLFLTFFFSLPLTKSCILDIQAKLYEYKNHNWQTKNSHKGRIIIAQMKLHSVATSDYCLILWLMPGKNFLCFHLCNTEAHCCCAYLKKKLLSHYNERDGSRLVEVRCGERRARLYSRVSASPGLEANPQFWRSPRPERQHALASQGPSGVGHVCRSASGVGEPSRAQHSTHC